MKKVQDLLCAYCNVILYVWRGKNASFCIYHVVFIPLFLAFYPQIVLGFFKILIWRCDSTAVQAHLRSSEELADCCYFVASGDTRGRSRALCQHFIYSFYYLVLFIILSRFFIFFNLRGKEVLLRGKTRGIIVVSVHAFLRQT